MAKTKSPEIYAQEFRDIMGDEYIQLTEYVKSNKKVRVLHKTCGAEYSVRAKNILRGSKCPECFGTRRKTTEEYKKELREALGKEYELLGEYRNTRSKVKVKHSCGHIMESRADMFLKSNGCTRCNGHYIRTEEDFVNDLDEDYSLVDTYIKVTEHVKLKHEVCGTSYRVTPANWYSGYRCPACGREKQVESTTISPEVYRETFYKTVDEGYVLLTDYVNSYTPISICHSSCGRVSEYTPYWIIHDGHTNPCKYCQSSRGEKRVYDYLESKGIEFEAQKIFDDCRNTRPLPFDFYLPKRNIIIEYNGRQHYEPSDYFGGGVGYQTRVLNDNKKAMYCMINELELIVIPYWDFNSVESLLDIKLSEKEGVNYVLH